MSAAVLRPFDRSELCRQRKRAGTGRSTTVRQNLFFDEGDDASATVVMTTDMEVDPPQPKRSSLAAASSSSSAFSSKNNSKPAMGRPSISRKSLGRTGRRTGLLPKEVAKRVSTGLEDVEAFFNSDEEEDDDEEKENLGSAVAASRGGRRSSIRRKSMVSIVEPDAEEGSSEPMEMVSPADVVDAPIVVTSSASRRTHSTVLRSENRHLSAVSGAGALAQAAAKRETPARQPRRYLDFESPASSSVARSTHHRMAKLAKTSMSALGNKSRLDGSPQSSLDDLSPISGGGIGSMSPPGFDDYSSPGAVLGSSSSLMSPPAPRTPSSARKFSSSRRSRRQSASSSSSSSATPSSSRAGNSNNNNNIRKRGHMLANEPATPDTSFSMVSGETSSGEDSDDDDFVPESFVVDDEDKEAPGDVTMSAMESWDDGVEMSPATYVDNQGRRRSSRTRVKPTAFWKGERVNYERTKMGRRVKEVVRVETPDRPAGKPLPKRRKVMYDDAPDAVVVRNKDKEEFEEDCIRMPTELGETLMRGKKNPQRIFTVRNAWDESDLRVGYVEVGAGCTTGLLNSGNFLEVFHVLRGDFEFTLHHTKVNVGANCVVKVPPFNKYKFKNLGEGRAMGKLCFTKICVDQALEMGAGDSSELEDSVLSPEKVH